MQLKMTTDYSVRLMIYLARRGYGMVINGRELSEGIGVTPGYLNKAALNLRRSGLIRSEQGQFGGFALGRNPKDITLYEILSASERTLKLNRCMEIDDYCGLKAAANCKLHAVLEELQSELETRLKSVRLSDLL